ncbi:MAG TPA: Zn-ribbon domain-containing OB-fold protein [Nitrososphaerales archaeon]|nr:Zn-ribbon domain-containing OB-fold protein [Nitrososphaerales archaeon]
MAVQYWRLRDRYYRLLGNACDKCGAEYFPPVYRCRKCGADKLVDKEMPKTGRILTYTVLHEPLPGFEAQAPYYLAVVDLDNGARVLAQLVDSPPEQIAIGAKVKATVRRIKEDGDSGQILYGYKFVVSG